MRGARDGPRNPQIRQKAEVPEASEAFRKEAEKEASEASEWGGWGLKTASGDFFEETPEYAGHDWPQTQQPRRENGDRDYDTASDVRNGPNVYTYVVQNPWTYLIRSVSSSTNGRQACSFPSVSVRVVDLRSPLVSH
ncbi:hypothetical protein [Puniceicoccus vermicola]|uniref:hypothetical protein n=1 Tax=Puniceicoccus vermicola TaxID=388746 RepID=UPI00339A48B7